MKEKEVGPILPSLRDRQVGFIRNEAGMKTEERKELRGGPFCSL